jgi:hypothetical protein
MPVTVNGTAGVTFNDATTQSTAFSSAAVLTAYSATTAGVVGAVAIRVLVTVPSGTTWSANSTVAGSAIYSGASGTWRALQNPVITGSTFCNCFGTINYFSGVYVRIS